MTTTSTFMSTSVTLAIPLASLLRTSVVVMAASRMVSGVNLARSAGASPKGDTLAGARSTRESHRRGQRPAGHRPTSWDDHHRASRITEMR
jgi:hypothetical protein